MTFLVRFCLVSFIALLFGTAVQAQQIASTDLTHPPSYLPNANTAQEKIDYPNGCKIMATGYADGEIVMQNSEPRKIKVELISISTATLAKGADITGTVKLQNTGSEQIEIPWSTDDRTAHLRQDSYNRAWEVGKFEVKLKGKDNYSAELKSTSAILFSSSFVTGSTLIVKPKEWTTAQISFKVEEQNPAYEKIEEGPSELVVEWAQISRTEKVEDCNLMQGFYPYAGSYQQSNPPTAVKVERDDSQKTSQ
jgi:hypothetical protein